MHIENNNNNNNITKINKITNITKINKITNINNNNNNVKIFKTNHICKENTYCEFCGHLMVWTAWEASSLEYTKISSINTMTELSKYSLKI